VLDDGKRREICALVAGGCGLREAADYVHCSVNTIRREAERNPDFAAQLHHSESHAQLTPLKAMQRAADTHWRAAAWMLERAFPNRFCRPEAIGFSERQARKLMKEIFEGIAIVIHDPYFLREVRKRIRRSFDRHIRIASDRRRNATSIRLAIDSAAESDATIEPVGDLDLPAPDVSFLDESSPNHGDEHAENQPESAAATPLPGYTPISPFGISCRILEPGPLEPPLGPMSSSPNDLPAFGEIATPDPNIQ
jgi:hypothetical protein